MDINDDYKNDIEEVRNLIRRSGGKIDAEVDSKGAGSSQFARHDS